MQLAGQALDRGVDESSLNGMVSQWQQSWAGYLTSSTNREIDFILR
jgi:hypothetical protein